MNPDEPDTNKQAALETIDSELIGIVYEVAFDPHFWPNLLESITELLTSDTDDTNPTPLAAQEAQRLATLLPHLYKALKLKRNYNETDHTRGQAQAILDKFPIGVLLVTANSKLVSANQHAMDVLKSSNSLVINNSILCAVHAEQDQQLKQFIAKAANTTLNDDSEQLSFIKINANDQKSVISILISPDPYPGIEYDNQANNYAAIFIASALEKQNISHTMLQTLFNLTPAEAKLAALLASGNSLGQAADHSCISKNTAKVQLKSIFLKMDISRQADLIKKILTSPAVFNPTDNNANKQKLDRHKLSRKVNNKSKINNEANCVLNDGRNLHYAEFGDPNGKPVIHLHGILGCRYERLPDDALTKQLGVRLIIPDRPGYGLSKYAADHGYLELADDLLELLDFINIDKVSIMGHSVGAIYGSAFAYQYPERVHRIAMISSTPPFRSFADFTGIPASLKLLIAFSKYLPSAAQMITEIAIKNACNNPKKFIANIPISHYDQAIFARPLLSEHLEHCLLAGSKDNHFGFVHDILLSAKPWPFPVADIQTTIDFWHGTHDLHSPVNRIKPIIDSIANKSFNKIDGAGHFLIYEYWQEILSSLAK